MDDLTRLASRARSGDREALTTFIQRTQTDVWRLCAYLTSSDQADDLTQETYTRACVGLRAFRGESSARTWLLSIAKRACFDAQRKAYRSAKANQRVIDLRSTPIHDADSSTDLRLLTEGLEIDQRTAFVLTQILGLSYEEAADVSSCAVGTIRSRVSRARAGLISMMAEAQPKVTERKTDLGS